MYPSTSLGDVPSDVIRTHIFKHLDGPTLASVSCASSQLFSLSKDESLWTKVCNTTWPSTSHPCMHKLVSEFPNGPFSFFSSCFPLLIFHPLDPPQDLQLSPPFPELVSCVDIYYKNKPIFSRFQQTKTDTHCFGGSSFQIDLLHPKDLIPMPVELTFATCKTLLRDLAMSWIIVIYGKKAANFSSFKSVSSEQHPETGDIEVIFATIFEVDKEVEVKCEIAVTLNEYMELCGVSMHLEDIDGLCLNGENSLKIIHREMETKERRKLERGEGRERYNNYMKKATDRRRNNSKWRRRLRSITFCAAASLGPIFFSFWIYFGYSVAEKIKCYA